MQQTTWRGVFAGLMVLACAAPSVAQAPPEPPGDVTSLAKTTQNPVSDLISLPFQFNFNTGGDLEQRTYFNLNFQPVVPFKMTTNWNAIARTILPINSVPGPDGTRYSGVGDIQEQLFFTPAKPGGIIWGVGPAFSFPTATATPLETGTWAAGFAAVVLKMTGPWVLGSLVTQFWPLSDAAGDPETDIFLVQPFVNYNFSRGWALSFSPNITANWNAPSGQEWTVPLGIGFTKTTVFNARPMNVGVTYYYNVARPDGSAAQQLRFAISLLYPERKK
jgi:hypothetical protein